MFYYIIDYIDEMITTGNCVLLLISSIFPSDKIIVWSYTLLERKNNTVYNTAAIITVSSNNNNNCISKVNFIDVREVL